MLKECLNMETPSPGYGRTWIASTATNASSFIVDEWGTWYRTEPGHPGYGLYQQNSLRDALLAGLTLHIFQEHNDRVHMANIAQIVNVLAGDDPHQGRADGDDANVPFI